MRRREVFNRLNTIDELYIASIQGAANEAFEVTIKPFLIQYNLSFTNNGTYYIIHNRMMRTINRTSRVELTGGRLVADTERYQDLSEILDILDMGVEGGTLGLYMPNFDPDGLISD